MSVQLTSKGEIKKCPKCETVALDNEEIELYFGHRWMNGKLSAQSWCKSCRRDSVKAKPPEIIVKGELAHWRDVDLSPGPVNILKPLRITANREEVRALYHEEFPRDSNWATRAMKFMVLKLIKKLPTAIVDDKVKVMFSL